jgi:hypothetical protein
MMVYYPAWSEIVALHQGENVVPRSHKAKIVRFLADAYPAQSAPRLYELFAEDRGQLGDSLHAETAQALARMDSLRPPDNQEWGRAVARGVAMYDSLLTQDTEAGHRDTATVGRALDVMTSFARVRDTAFAARATHGLLGYARAVMARDGETARARRRALSAVGRLRYQKALPFLESLYVAQSAGRTTRSSTDDILDVRNRVVRRAYSASVDTGSLGGQKELLGILRILKDAPKGLREDLEQRVADAENTVALIANHPAEEYGYRRMLNQYTDRGDVTGGVRALDSLKRELPTRVWPRKLLSEAYHENLAPDDSTYFAKSYAEMRMLRELPEYRTIQQSARTDYRRIESDYVEVALSARQFEEADRVARRLLEETTDSTEWLNATLFAYMAMALKGDTAAALARLDELAAFAHNVPVDFVNNWRYPGTMAFLRASRAPAPLTAALLRLCKGEKWFSRAEAAAIIAENRRALGSRT